VIFGDRCGVGSGWGGEQVVAVFEFLDDGITEHPTGEGKVYCCVICRRQWKPGPLWHAGSVTMKDGCDEFPFASTYESGAMPPDPVADGAQCAQVKAEQTSDTGAEPCISNLGGGPQVMGRAR
jgi:hypothetical protein